MELLAFTFRRSLLRKPLLITVMKHIIGDERNKDKLDDIILARKLGSRHGHYATDVFTFTLTCLFKARAYTEFAHFYRATAEKFSLGREWENAVKTFWHDLLNLKEDIAEIFTTTPEHIYAKFFKEITKDLPAERFLLVLNTLLKEVPEGRSFVLESFKVTVNPLSWAKFLFAIDYEGDEDLISDVCRHLTECFDKEASFWPQKHIDEAKALMNMRFFNGPVIHPTEDRVSSAEIMMTMNRFDEAASLYYRSGTNFDYYNFIRRLEFHRYLLYNRLPDYQNYVDFSPTLVNYDLQDTLHFFETPDFYSAMDTLRWRQCADRVLGFAASVSKMIYLHLSVKEFEEFVRLSRNINAAEMNLDALIEIKGESSDFMGFFAVFVKNWKKINCRNDYLNLKPSNMGKLQTIPGALELLFDDLNEIEEDNFLDLLNYKRSYELLLKKKDTLCIFSRLKKLNEYYKPVIMNETVHNRVREFSYSDELQAKIKANKEKLLGYHKNWFDPKLWH